MRARRQQRRSTLAARFLNRFVAHSIPWLHLDLAGRVNERAGWRSYHDGYY